MMHVSCGPYQSNSMVRNESTMSSPPSNCTCNYSKLIYTPSYCSQYSSLTHMHMYRRAGAQTEAYLHKDNCTCMLKTTDKLSVGRRPYFDLRRDCLICVIPQKY